MLSRCCIVAVLILVSLFVQEAVAAAQYGSNSTDGDMEVLTRGPIHEAFAEVSVNEAKPETVISHSVPEPINEIPPDYRPEGDNVQWIPGYWSWDDEQNDFIWVSGVWRDLPPGRQWVPGYWMQVDGGNQYVSGYWSEPSQSETVYLPPPPEPPSTAPGVPAYSADSIWVDGHWLWSHNGYAWQAGYWLRQRPEMAWIPAHYVWTPRGYIFVPGYWDYQIVRRGVMFAPRYYSRPIYREHSYYYTPSIVLDINAIFLSLFVRQHHHHYYFGDYHDVRWERRGYVPWYSEHATRHGYDPYYRSYRWYRSKHDKEWEHNYRHEFEYRRDHREARPPVRYRPHEDRNFTRQRDDKRYVLGTPLTEFARKNDHNVRLIHTRPDEKHDYRGQHSGKGTRQESERKPAKVMPQTKDRPWVKKSTTMIGERDRDQASSNNRKIEQTNLSERQQRGGNNTQHVKPYPQKHNQLVESQAGNQPPKKGERLTRDLPRFDQNKKEPQQRGGKPDVSRSGNQSERIDPKKEHRMAHQPQKVEERRQPMTSKGQKNIERPKKQQKFVAAPGPDQQSGPGRVNEPKGKGSVKTEGQIEGQDEVIPVNGQTIKRPRIGVDQQRGRSDQK